MKKHLYLIRHATAENGAPMFRDFDRELTSDGIMEAARMGAKLASRKLIPDRIVCSAALRTFQTAKIFAEQLSFDVELIVSNENMFDGGPRMYLAELAGTPEDCRMLFMVGHNPDISYFGEYLTKSYIGSMDKGSVVIIEFDGLSWAEISGNTGVMKEYLKPE